MQLLLKSCIRNVQYHKSLMNSIFYYIEPNRGKTRISLHLGLAD